MQQWEENEEKKDYLRRYKKAKNREQRILDEIQRLMLDKRFPSVTNDGMPHGTDVGDLSDYIVMLEEEIEKLKQERLEKVKIYREIEDRVREMRNENEQEVLRLRYLTGLPWERVAVEMGYSWRQIHNFHASALRNFNIA